MTKELKTSKARLREAVEASGTSLTDIYGVGPVVAGLIIGYSGDVSRFPTRHHYAAYNRTRPHRGLLRTTQAAPAQPQR